MKGRTYMSEINTIKSHLITFPHGFSTRTGGVSEGIFASLNLGMSRGDDADKVKENYRRFFDSCGIKKIPFVCGKQVHGNNVMIVDADNARPAYGYGTLYEADGYVTSTPGVPLVVFTADCIPLLLADEKNRVVAAVHSGWRSTVADIEKVAVEIVCERHLVSVYENSFRQEYNIGNSFEFEFVPVCIIGDINSAV